MRLLAPLAFSTLLVVACQSESQEGGLQATDYVRVQIAETGEPSSCFIEMTSSISKSSNLYMLNFDRYVNGQKQMLSQIKFTGHDQIDFVRDTTSSGVFKGAPCQTYDVSWRNLECEDTNRQAMDCPEIRFEANGVFASIEVGE